MKKFLSITLLLCFAIPTMAQVDDTQILENEISIVDEITTESIQLETKDVGMLPTNPFYFLKNVSRNIRLAFTFSPVKKAELRQRFANQQLLEIDKLVERGTSSEVIERTTQRYENQQEKLREIMERIQDSDVIESFRKKYLNQQMLHEEVLERIQQRVPEDAVQNIEQAMTRHLERFGEVMSKIENTEQIPVRLRNALENTRIMEKVQNQVQNEKTIRSFERAREMVAPQIINENNVEIKQIKGNQGMVDEIIKSVELEDEQIPAEEPAQKRTGQTE